MIVVKTSLLNQCMLVCMALLISSSPALASQTKLKASVPSFPPFNYFVENSQCAGASVVALEMIFEKLNVELELVSYPYARILHSLKNAELDLALIFKNNSISHDINYIGPLAYSKIIILSQPNHTINQYDDLQALKRIAVIRNAQFEKKFDQDKGLNKVSVDSYQQAIRMLKHGRVDAVIGSLIGLEYALLQQNMNQDMLSNVFYLGKKEWGLHLAKNSNFAKLKPDLIKAVKQTFKTDLIHQLYQQQIQHCVSTN